MTRNNALLRWTSAFLSFALFIFGVGVPGALAQSTPTASAPSPGPHWSCEAAYYDFGEVWAGVTVTKPYEFKNVGTQTLKILEAKPKCSCSIAENYTKEVPPGKTGVIPFKLNTTAKNGRVDESLTIKTNDPTNPEMVLRLAGLVKTVCRIEVIHDESLRDNSAELMKLRATAAQFGRITSNQKLGRLLRLNNLTGSPLSLELVSVTPEDSRFRAHLKALKPLEEYELTVRGDPPFPDGYNSATMNFKTNIPDNPEYKIAVSAYVPARVEVIPQKIVIDPDFPPVSTRIIRINNNGDSPLEITGIASTDPNLHLSLLPNSASTPKTRGVQLIIPQGYRPPDYGELIRINTTDKEKSQIDIPVLPTIHAEPVPRPADKPIKFHPGSMPTTPAGQ